MLFFGVCDLPVFWGTDNLWNCTTENGSTEWLWWLEYFCKLPIYLGDLFCAVVLPLVSEKGTPSRILGTLQNQVGNDAINALGVFEALASTALLMGSGKKPIDVYWFATQIVSMVSSLTAVVRVLPVFATSPVLRAVSWRSTRRRTSLPAGPGDDGLSRRAARPDEGRSSSRSGRQAVLRRSSRPRPTSGSLRSDGP